MFWKAREDGEMVPYNDDGTPVQTGSGAVTQPTVAGQTDTVSYTENNSQTKLQALMQNPLLELIAQSMSRLRSKPADQNLASLLKNKLDPAIQSVYGMNMMDATGATGEAANINSASNNFLNPLKLNLNFNAPELNTGYSGVNLNKNFLNFDRDSFYNNAMADVRQNADLEMKRNREMLQEAGLGSSTILSNVNEGANQRLADASVKASNMANQAYYDAGLKAQQMSNEAAINESTFNNNAQNMGNLALMSQYSALNDATKSQNEALTNQFTNSNSALKDYINARLGLGNYNQGIRNALVGNANTIMQNNMFNQQTDYNEALRLQNGYDKDQNFLLSLYNGQMPMATQNAQNANQLAMAQYQADMAAEANQNDLFGTIGALIFGGKGLF